MALTTARSINPEFNDHAYEGLTEAYEKQPQSYECTEYWRNGNAGTNALNQMPRNTETVLLQRITEGSLCRNDENLESAYAFGIKFFEASEYVARKHKLNHPTGIINSGITNIFGSTVARLPNGDPQLNNLRTLNKEILELLPIIDDVSRGPTRWSEDFSKKIDNISTQIKENPNLKIDSIDSWAAEKSTELRGLPGVTQYFERREEINAKVEEAYATDNVEELANAKCERLHAEMTIRQSLAKEGLLLDRDVAAYTKAVEVLPLTKEIHGKIKTHAISLLEKVLKVED